MHHEKDLAAIQDDAWAVMAAILSVPESDHQTLDLLKEARTEWTHYANKPGSLEPSAEMKRNLEKTASFAFELKTLVEKIRDYMPLEELLWYNGISPSAENKSSPFSDQQLKFLSQMAFFAQETADIMKITRGSKGDTPRRLAWIAAAEIYEKATGRTAYHSMSSQQEIDGPFTRYLMAFCRFCFPANRHEVESVEAFCKWMQRVRLSGGYPTLRVLGMDAVRT